MARRGAAPVHEGVPNKKRTVEELRAKLSKALDFDGWGQPVEAVDNYRRVLHSISFECGDSRYVFNEDEKQTLKDLQHAVQLRCQSLRESGDSEVITLDALRKATSALNDLAVGKKVTKFPINLPLTTPSPPPSELSMSPTDFAEEDDHFQLPSPKQGGTLLPCPEVEPGHTVLQLHIDKIGLKDAGEHIDPILTVSVKDSLGGDITKSQDTPIAATKEDLYVHFNVDIFIQCAVEKLIPNAAIFFEFKHYKPKKKKYSTRCFAFLERDEFKPGQACLELYQKPTNFQRRKLNLFTIKPLFLHLHIKLLES